MPITTPPEVSRRIRIGEHEVNYQLRRSSRRTIGLTIDQRGLRVGAPSRASLGDIESLIRRHGEWVIDKLANWRATPAAETFRVTDGCSVFCLGLPLTVTVTPIGRARWQWAGDRLHLWPAATTSANLLLEKALREKARTVFAERLAQYAPALGVSPPPLRLSSARTRWGSCSHRGGISLNWRLIHLPLAIIDYVVAHELAHLREMNHSPRFWAVVESLCPDWRQRRLELREKARSLPVLS